MILFHNVIVMASQNYEIAHEQWKSFYEFVMFHQRYFISHPLLVKLQEIVAKCEMNIDPGSVYYRARIIDAKAARYEHMVAKCYGEGSTEEDQKLYRNKDNKFRGLCKEGSYVPPDPKVVRDGRSNPRFIRYLYMAESPTTAVFEVRPLLNSAVNVAGIVVKEPLRIADIAVDIDMDPEKVKGIDEWLLSFIQCAFSSPTNNPDDYIPTQIIAEFFRHLGYDGIRYSSSLHKGGFNLTVFDTSKCEPIFSTDLRLDNMKISLRPAMGAENIDGRFEYIYDNVPMRFDKHSMKMVKVQGDKLGKVIIENKRNFATSLETEEKSGRNGRNEI